MIVTCKWNGPKWSKDSLWQLNMAMEQPLLDVLPLWMLKTRGFPSDVWLQVPPSWCTIQDPPLMGLGLPMWRSLLFICTMHQLRDPCMKIRVGRKNMKSLCHSQFSPFFSNFCLSKIPLSLSIIKFSAKILCQFVNQTSELSHFREPYYGLPSGNLT